MATSHRADLPEPKKINPDLRFKFFNHILNRAVQRVRINWGIVIVFAVLLGAIACVFYGVQEISERLG